MTLNPREQIASSPYSIRTLSAAQADLALDSQKLGGNVGVYRIAFGFSVTNRFFAVTPRYATTCNVAPIQWRNTGNLEVFTFNADNAADTAEASFTAIDF